MDVYGIALAINCLSVCPSMQEQGFVSYEGVAHRVLYVICANVVIYYSFKSGLPLSLSLSLTHSHNHLCSHKQMCFSLCVASFIQFCKCTWAFTVMLMCALFMTVYENVSPVVLHHLQPLQFPRLITHTLHITAHMCTQNSSMQRPELNLRPYINCV